MLERTTPKRAAEIVYGEMLVERGKLAKLRAKVWIASKPRTIERFFVPETAAPSA